MTPCICWFGGLFAPRIAKVMLAALFAAKAMAPIIAREIAAVVEKEFGAAFIRKMRVFIRKPELSVVKDALLANKTSEIHAMHDPTE